MSEQSPTKTITKKRRKKKSECRMNDSLSLLLLFRHYRVITSVFVFWVAAAAAAAVTEEATTAAAASASAASQQECVAMGDLEIDQCIQLQQDQSLFVLPPEAQPVAECAVFLAQSTIPGAGVGIFTAHAKHRGDAIALTGDICIPFIDLYWHNHHPLAVNPFRDYFWTGYSMGMVRESDSDDIEAYCPGLDCAVNTHPALNNLDKMTPTYDDAGLVHSRGDAGAGAFTPYHNGTTYVSMYRDIPAGAELFKDYGAGWFQYRAALFAHVPMASDYDSAHTLLQNLFTTHVFHASTSTTRTTTIQAELYDLIKGLGRRVYTESLVLKALPETYKEAQWVLHLDHHHENQNNDTESPPALVEEARDIAALQQPKFVRSMQDLHTLGVCMDHIQNRPSTLFPQAGRGAFAVRHLPKGTLVAASPLHHVHEHFANMYPFIYNSNSNHDDENYWTRINDQIMGKQLMLNYCFQHHQSPVLLCPYGAGINYLNHHFDKSQVNVQVQWATHMDMDSYMHKHALLLPEEQVLDDSELSTLSTTSLEAFLLMEKPQLAFEYVALRDIAPDEELFLDYGPVWEEAWHAHEQRVRQRLQQQQQPENAYYISARSMNARFPDSVLRTEAEQEFDPYPAHLELRCHTGLLIHATNYVKGNAASTTDTMKTFRWSLNDVGVPCRVLYREWIPFPNNDTTTTTSTPPSRSTQALYTVEVEATYASTTTFVVVVDVPRISLAFVDVPGTTDLHWPLDRVFRHAIGLPDALWYPEHWKTKKTTEEEEEEEETTATTVQDSDETTESDDDDESVVEEEEDYNHDDE